MTLNKRYFRSIRENLSFYISAGVLTIATLFLFYMMNIAGRSISDFGKKFFDEQQIEDANFTTYLPISEDDMSDLEREYGVTIEVQRYHNIETDGVTTRLFQRTHEIDKYKITVGRDVENNHEIIISEGFAVENQIELSDMLKIGQKEYTVVGYFQRPDYLYMLVNENDAYKNITTFYLAYTTDEEFDSYGKGNVQYLIRYNGNDDEAIRKVLNEKFILRTYLSSKDNARITMVDVQAELFVTLSYVLLPFMPLIAVALVSIIISRKVKSEQKLIGTLTALGYSKRKILWHYAGFAMIPGILGGVVSVLFASIFAQWFGELGLQDYEPMRIVCQMQPFDAIIGIFVPTLLYIIAAMLSVNRLLKKDTVLLLNSNVDADRKKMRKVLAEKKISFRIKFAVRSLLGNPARTFVVFLGIFMGSYIALLGFGFIDAMAHSMDNVSGEMGTFEYEYVLNTLVDESQYDAEPALIAQMEDADGKFITLMGVDWSNPYINKTCTDGHEITEGNGIYLSSVAAMLFDAKAGDTISIFDPISLNEYNLKIDGIVQNDMQRLIYVNRSYAASLIGIDEKMCNMLMSDQPVTIDASYVAQEVKKADFENQVQTMINQMDIMLYFVIVLGVIICVASVYVAVNMLVTEMRGNISMLKVLGYKDKQINKIVLRVNHIILPIGILISIPLVYLSCGGFFKILADYVGMMIKPYISFKSVIYAAVLTGISYFGSVFLVKRKVSKVNMVESLKDTRE
ncbi:MAG: FtsX-like permease family protein [Eubacteriales bacterium]|nr:FtsX-like permease family protein [Eubacteriales bacterium]